MLQISFCVPRFNIFPLPLRRLVLDQQLSDQCILQDRGVLAHIADGGCSPIIAHLHLKVGSDPVCPVLLVDLIQLLPGVLEQLYHLIQGVFAHIHRSPTDEPAVQTLDEIFCILPLGNQRELSPGGVQTTYPASHLKHQLKFIPGLVGEDGHALFLLAVQKLEIAGVALGQIVLCTICQVLFTLLSHSTAGGQDKHAGRQNGQCPFLSLCFVQLSPDPLCQVVEEAAFKNLDMYLTPILFLHEESNFV